MNAARLFPRVGIALWRTPIDRLLPDTRDLRVVQRPELPPDIQAEGIVHEVPGWPADKPYVGGWTHLARPYPPGVLLLVAPIAALYHATPLSFAAACHLLVLLFVFFAHAAFLVVAQSLPDRARATYVAGALVSYAYTVFWALHGFYDPAAMLPVLLCIGYADARRWFASCIAFCVALFLHYRALFFVPWALWAAYHVARERQWRSWTAREWIAVGGATVAAGTALFTFWVVRPTLGQMPLANPIHPGDLKPLPIVAFAATFAVAAAIFARARSYFDLAVLGWMTLMLVSIRQTQGWHTLLILPWVFARATSDPVRFGRIAYLVVLTGAVFL
jgi:hypothetical protein